MRAAWGYVVAARDHVERSLSGLLGTAARGVEPREDPEVLGATLDLVEAQDADATSPLSSLVDVERVAATGHSAGAGAAYRMTSVDDRIDAFAAYSVGSGDSEDPLPEVPARPGLVMLGECDAIIEPDATRDVFEAMGPPKYLAEVPGVGSPRVQRPVPHRRRPEWPRRHRRGDRAAHPGGVQALGQ